MKIDDLGVLNGDVLLFGGPYSNLQATRALFAETGLIPRSNRICTGDMIAYCANPLETAQLVLAETATVVAGNCEIQVGQGAVDCGCGFKSGSVCDLASKNWFPFAQAKVAGAVGQLKGLPDIAVFQHNKRRYAVIHGGVTDVARFVWPSDAEAVFTEEIGAIESNLGPIDGVIAGHCGIAFERHVSDRIWINAGVIGMPPHDGRPQSRYAILSDDGVRFHSLDYDFHAASGAMVAEGLTLGYEVALQNGIWPSEDVLPKALRR